MACIVCARTQLRIFDRTHVYLDTPHAREHRYRIDNFVAQFEVAGMLVHTVVAISCLATGCVFRHENRFDTSRHVSRNGHRYLYRTM